MQFYIMLIFCYVATVTDFQDIHWCPPLVSPLRTWRGPGANSFSDPPSHLARKRTRNLQIKQLRQYLYGILRLRDRMADSSWIFIDLIVIPAFANTSAPIRHCHYRYCRIREEGQTFVSLISKKVNLRKHALLLNVLEAIGLIPPGGKYVERYLSTNAVCQPVVCKVLPERFDKVSADIVGFVVGFEVVAFLDSVFPSTRLAL